MAMMALLAPLAAAAQTAPMLKLSGGLEAKVNWIGRNAKERTVTVSMTVSNPSAYTYYLMYMGPTGATDNAGGTYNFRNVTGILTCPKMNSGAWQSLCVSTAAEFPQMFSRVDPGTSLTLNFALGIDRPTVGPMLSFSSVLAARVVPDVDKDAAVSDVQKWKAVFPLNLGFPMASIVDQPQ